MSGVEGETGYGRSKMLMPHPTGMLMTSRTITPEVVRHALDEQGGPEWDQTVFRMLTGVDLNGLAHGQPEAGTGTAISFASSGWWVRSLDVLADRLSADVDAPVLAVFEAPDARASGYHLARPGQDAERGLSMVPAENAVSHWGEGVGKLLGSEVRGELPALGDVARTVHGDDPDGFDLPSVFAFSLADAPKSEKQILGEVYGTSLVGGWEWKPGARRDPAEAIPDRMRVIVLSGPPRLPGPPRWAKADRADAIEVARRVMDEDGWICLVPKVGDVLGIYGSAVQLSQFAPLPHDGRWAGVLHPREAVRIGDFDEDGFAHIEKVEQKGISDAQAFDRALSRLIDALPEKAPDAQFDEAELRASSDPAQLIAWQLPVTPELSQSYLGSTEPTTRLEVLLAALRA